LQKAPRGACRGLSIPRAPICGRRFERYGAVLPAIPRCRRLICAAGRLLADRSIDCEDRNQAHSRVH
jgi:hypothetical protein